MQAMAQDGLQVAADTDACHESDEGTLHVELVFEDPCNEKGKETHLRVDEIDSHPQRFTLRKSDEVSIPSRVFVPAFK